MAIIKEFVATQSNPVLELEIIFLPLETQQIEIIDAKQQISFPVINNVIENGQEN